MFYKNQLQLPKWMHLDIWTNNKLRNLANKIYIYILCKVQLKKMDHPQVLLFALPY